MVWVLLRLMVRKERSAETTGHTLIKNELYTALYSIMQQNSKRHKTQRKVLLSTAMLSPVRKTKGSTPLVYMRSAEKCQFIEANDIKQFKSLNTFSVNRPLQYSKTPLKAVSSIAIARTNYRSPSPSTLQNITRLNQDNKPILKFHGTKNTIAEGYKMAPLVKIWPQSAACPLQLQLNNINFRQINHHCNHSSATRLGDDFKDFQKNRKKVLPYSLDSTNRASTHLQICYFWLKGLRTLRFHMFPKIQFPFFDSRYSASSTHRNQSAKQNSPFPSVVYLSTARFLLSGQKYRNWIDMKVKEISAQIRSTLRVEWKVLRRYVVGTYVNMVSAWKLKGCP